VWYDIRFKQTSDINQSLSLRTEETFEPVLYDSPRNEIWIYWSESNSWIYFFIFLNKNWKKILIRTKFYLSWTGGTMLIVMTVCIKLVSFFLDNIVYLIIHKSLLIYMVNKIRFIRFVIKKGAFWSIIIIAIASQKKSSTVTVWF